MQHFPFDLIFHLVRSSYRFTEAWQITDRVFVHPSALEMFLRSFLTTRLGSSSADDQPSSCSSAADCKPCRALPAECSFGQCVCPVAFYHTALDPGLEPEPSPGHFQVVDPATPNYAEPNWEAIGVTTYEVVGTATEFW